MATKHCVTCNREFDARASKKYCAPECNPRVAPKRACETCGAPLAGKGRRYCSSKCWPESSRRYLLRYHGGKSSTPPPLCAICKVALATSRNLCGHKHCQNEWNKRRNGVRICVQCGTEFMAQSKRTQVCSMKCRAAPLAFGEYASETERQTVKGHRRRARIMAVYVEDVVPSVVFERDGWICQLCHQPVDPTLHGWDRMAATLDHIIPLTCGGLHAYSNAQLAHRACNSSKSNNWHGQLALA